MLKILTLLSLFLLLEFKSDKISKKSTKKEKSRFTLNRIDTSPPSRKETSAKITSFAFGADKQDKDGLNKSLPSQKEKKSKDEQRDYDAFFGKRSRFRLSPKKKASLSGFKLDKSNSFNFSRIEKPATNNDSLLLTPLKNESKMMFDSVLKKTPIRPRYHRNEKTTTVASTTSSYEETTTPLYISSGKGNSGSTKSKKDNNDDDDDDVTTTSSFEESKATSTTASTTTTSEYENLATFTFSYNSKDEVDGLKGSSSNVLQSFCNVDKLWKCCSDFNLHKKKWAPLRSQVCKKYLEVKNCAFNYIENCDLTVKNDVIDYIDRNMELDLECRLQNLLRKSYKAECSKAIKFCYYRFNNMINQRVFFWEYESFKCAMWMSYSRCLKNISPIFCDNKIVEVNHFAYKAHLMGEKYCKKLQRNEISRYNGFIYQELNEINELQAWLKWITYRMKKETVKK